jgi:hypothetical protein
MSALDSILTAITSPDVLFYSRNQGDNFDDYVSRMQKSINAETDPAKKIARQRSLDAFIAEQSGTVYSISPGATQTAVDSVKQTAGTIAKETGSIISNVVPWQVWAILAAAVGLFVYLRFAK